MTDILLKSRESDIWGRLAWKCNHSMSIESWSLD